MRRRHAVVGLMVGTVTAVLLVAPVAWADDADIVVAGGVAPVTESPAGSVTAPIALAHTGLDVTVPTIVGLAVLLLGTVLVVWAVLRGSRSRGTHS